MAKISVHRQIDAPVPVVFKAVSDIGNFPNISEEVIKIEFLTDQQHGVGTKFRETRLMKNQEHLTELEVTEYTENESIRMVTDSHGTVWDTVFSVTPAENGCELDIAMDARPHKLMPKILNPFLKGMFRRGMETYIDTLKSYCEAQTENVSSNP